MFDTRQILENVEQFANVANRVPPLETLNLPILEIAKWVMFNLPEPRAKENPLLQLCPAGSESE